MFSRARALLRWRSGHGVLLTFVVAILVPGILIAFIGFRALLQERRLADQQIRESVDRAAELAARDLEQELRQWQETVGDADPAVPFSQSQLFEEELAKTGVTVELIRVPGGGHSGDLAVPNAPDYFGATVEWFDRYLRRQP